MAEDPTRLRDQAIIFADGTVGRHVDVPSASPTNFHQVISAAPEMPRLVIDAKLFLPPSAKPPLPLVIVVPGSLGVAPSHVAHAETLFENGIATCILDSFGARQVTSTVADQTQFLSRPARMTSWPRIVFSPTVPTSTLAASVPRATAAADRPCSPRQRVASPTPSLAPARVSPPSWPRTRGAASSS